MKQCDQQDLPRSNADDRALEQQLGWAEDTLAVLRHAFTHELSRHLKHIPSHPACVTAARYYKRGVVLPGKSPPLPVLSTQLRGVAQLRDLQTYFADRFVVCDQQIAQLHMLNVPQLTTIVATEEHKSLATVAKILQRWRAQGSRQQWTIIGGGITLDVAVFAAALAKAEIVLIPTTLLAMIDAAHGGKNGVNFPPWGKNQLGTYYWPERVLICPAWLQTLPPLEIQAGAWEGIKHALIAGDQDLLQAWLQCSTKPPTSWQSSLLQKTAEIKTAIVRRDPYEHGKRKVLNLGHTLAHALEAVAQDNGTPLRHGHAVGIGILYALLLSRALGRIHQVPHCTALCNSLAPHFGLTKSLGHDLDATQLWKKLQHYLAQDKKRRGNKMWILLHAAEPLPRVSSKPQAVHKLVVRRAWRQLTELLP